MIASIGGGLCQLSNALYAAALAAGMDIIERHAHSQIVPGSAAESGRDATVFWNYVDLRFRAQAGFAMEAVLTGSDLIVRLRTQAAPGASPTSVKQARGPIHLRLEAEPRDCVRCEYEQCVQHIESNQTNGHTAFLLDECWPEFDRWAGSTLRPGDTVLLPLDGKRRNRPAYAWTLDRCEGLRIIEHPFLAIWRGRAAKGASGDGCEIGQCVCSPHSV